VIPGDMLRTMADEKIIKEGGYQPTEDPPDRPPSSVIKPASEPGSDPQSGDSSLRDRDD
jgi:hypothetical protein